TAAKAETDIQLDAELRAHLQSLQSGFEKISSNTGVPIKVFRPNGELLETYQQGRQVPVRTEESDSSDDTADSTDSETTDNRDSGEEKETP
ncbi:MAG: hypothetical protein AAGG02_19655, partial [Cyanobacteria bacterium P01_H01_bin.15]